MASIVTAIHYAGVTYKIHEHGNGPIVSKRKGEQFLPCKCDSAFVHCTCKLGEYHCSLCGKIYIKLPNRTWGTIDDPHPRNVSAPEQSGNLNTKGGHVGE